MCLACERNLFGTSLGLPPLVDNENSNDRLATPSAHQPTLATHVAEIVATTGVRGTVLDCDSSEQRLWPPERAHCGLPMENVWGVRHARTSPAISWLPPASRRISSSRVGDSERREVRLADPRLLHSDERTYLIKEREQLAIMIVEDERRRDEGRPIQLRPSGVELRGRPVVRAGQSRGNRPTGKAVVMTVFGDDEEHVEILAMSVPGRVGGSSTSSIRRSACPSVPPAQRPPSV